jgi:D-glycero-D-manno-heptose 1,7-bisphosphate phosphatase
VIFCPHTADDQCDCRKPKPGMVHEVMERFNVRGDGLPMVGDSLRDLQAVAEVGGLPLLVRTGKGMRTLDKGGLPAGTQVFDDLFDAADYLINLDN